MLEILNLPPDERDAEIRKLIVPKPWKHGFQWPMEIIKPSEFPVWCYNCEENIPHSVATYPCPVPDPIALDWNLAKKMAWNLSKGKQRYEDVLLEMSAIEYPRAEQIGGGSYTGFNLWLMFYAKPQHHILAAWEAKESK